MELKDLMAISGYPGLYRFISQGRNSIIVESLDDGKRMSAYSTSRISTLEEIAIFTETGEVALGDVFQKMYDHAGGQEVLSHKSHPEELREFFGKILPEYDRERVYVSDIKKVVNWYNLLIGHNLLKPIDDQEDKAAEKSETDEKVSGSDEQKATIKKQAKNTKPKEDKGAGKD